MRLDDLARTVLGRSSWDDVDAAALADLCASGAAETDLLDFKRDYWDKTAELAKDVTALLNGQGGILVVGIEEDGGSAASTLCPVPNSNYEERVRQVLNGMVRPVPEVSVRTVPALTADGCFVLIGVTPSEAAPHCVAEKAGALSFPVRSGTTTRYLNEHELANLYQERQRRGQRLLDRMNGLQLNPLNSGNDDSFVMVAHMVPLSAIEPRPLDEVGVALAAGWGKTSNEQLSHFISFRKAHLGSPSAIRAEASLGGEVVCEISRIQRLQRVFGGPGGSPSGAKLRIDEETILGTSIAAARQLHSVARELGVAGEVALAAKWTLPTGESSPDRAEAEVPYEVVHELTAGDEHLPLRASGPIKLSQQSTFIPGDGRGILRVAGLWYAEALSAFGCGHMRFLSITGEPRWKELNRSEGLAALVGRVLDDNHPAGPLAEDQ
jgi:hypothetical protein